MKYPYSPELPKPFSFGDLNFESNPVVKLGFKAYIALTKAQVKKLHCPKKRVGEIDCYQVEPQTEEKLPAILYCHGGGFVFPLQPMMFQNSAYYRDRLGCRVFLPEYRYAPKFPFPTPLEDCLNTYKYIYENAECLRVDRNRMIVLGDSAGGALAAAVCLRLRDEGYNAPVCQVLLYPVTDNSMRHESMVSCADANWTRSATAHMWSMYLKNGDRGQLSYAAPLQSADLRGLPPAYVEVCEFDCLRDEGLAYAEKLKTGGVPVESHVVKGAYHGYDAFIEVPLVREHLEKRVNFMKKYLEG